MKKLDGYNNIRLCVALRKALSDKHIKKLSSTRIINFIEKYKDDYEKVYFLTIPESAGHHVLPGKEIFKNFINDFIELIGDAYGEHAKKILLERPNLTLSNIQDFRVFDKGLYVAFGESFINQLLNINYDMVFGSLKEYDQAMDEITSDKDALGTLKFCYDLISEKDNEKVYDITKLFKIYAEPKFKTLLRDCYKNRSNLTDTQIETLKEVLILNSVEINSVDELNTFNDKVKEYYDGLVEGKTKLNLNEVNERVGAISYALYKRFFGLDNYYTGKAKNYSRNINDVRDIVKYYNLNRLLIFEKQLMLNNEECDLTQKELKLLEVLCSCDVIIKGIIISKYRLDKYGIEKSEVAVEVEDILKNLYYAFDKASVNGKGVVNPLDFRTLVDKLPKIYENYIKNTLTSVDDLEKAVTEKQKGVTKSRISKIVNGKVISIPVYNLQGINFSYLTNYLEANFSVDYLPYYKNTKEMIENFFKFENGASHICLSYVNSISQASVEFTKKGFDNTAREINVIMPKDVDFICMGPSDIWSTAGLKTPETMSNEHTHFELPFDLSCNSCKVNEIVVDRYAMKGKFSGRPIPEGIFKIGDIPHPRIVEYAVNMTLFLREQGLVDETYEFPIVMCDLNYYKNDYNVKNEIIETAVAKKNKFDELEYKAKKSYREHMESMQELSSKLDSGKEFEDIDFDVHEQF